MPRHHWLLLAWLTLGLLPCQPARSADREPTDHALIAGFDRFYSGDDANPQEGGELLLGELGCVNCHQPDEAVSRRVLSRSAPRLERVGSRLRPEYLRRFLSEPHGTDPGTPMPDPLAGRDEQSRASVAEALTHYLASLEHEEPAEPSKQGDAERGERLYHTVGCVACHAPDSGFHPEGDSATSGPPAPETPSVPLNELDRKYRSGALAAFLEDPLAVRPSARMPHTRLSAREASDIATYLRKRSSAQAPEDQTFTPKPNLVGKGRGLFAQLGCGACHRSDDRSPLPPSTLQAPLLADASSAPRSGCLATEPQSGVPHYHLSDQQRSALRAALEQISPADQPDPATQNPTTPNPATLARRRMTALNCYACHQRRERGGPGSVRAHYFRTTADQDLGQEGRFPPPLTHAGAKFQRDALRQIIRGDGAVRPYMATRMPGFGDAHADRLTDLMTEADLTDEFTTGQRLRGRTHWGRKLVGVNGLGCVTCHGLNGHESLGVPALDLATVPDRLRRGWFRKYLINPARFRPGTRMPSLWPEGEPSNPGIGFGSGHAKTRRQINSIWIYLSSIDQNPLPEGLANPERFVLKPEERGEPIILRAFMKEAGMHAIAVGYPQRTHVVFDARRMRFALAWRGQFLDAEGVWWKRRLDMLEPLGKDVVRLSPAGPFAMLADPEAVWPEEIGRAAGYRFGGYRLDENGVPTFLYRFNGIEIEERLAPGEDAEGLRRSITLLRSDEATEGKQKMWFRAAVGQNIRRVSDHRWAVDDRVKVRWIEPAGAKPRIVRPDGKRELRFPIELNDQGTAHIEMELNW